MADGFDTDLSALLGPAPVGKTRIMAEIQAILDSGCDTEERNAQFRTLATQETGSTPWSIPDSTDPETLYEALIGQGR